MKASFTKSSERSVSKASEKDRAKESVKQLILALESGNKPHGLGLKKLHDEIWEIRAGLRTGVLFALFPGEIRFLLVGNHEEVNRFLQRR